MDKETLEAKILNLESLVLELLAFLVEKRLATKEEIKELIQLVKEEIKTK